MRRSWRISGRLVPASARLHSRSVRLPRGACMAWHTTGTREELLIAVAGAVIVEWRRGAGRLRRVTLRAGQALFVPSRTAHQVRHAGVRAARYMYVTG